MKAPVTAIVLTLNEEANIGACLQSLDWADDVIVVDSGSTDRTVGAARAARPDVHVFEHTFQDFGDQRNWALDNASPRNEWILFLDADERVTPACAAAIAEAVRSPGDKVGFYLCYRNFFLGRWIKRCTLYPSWQLRLLKKGAVRFRKEGHGQREVTDGPLDYIREPYDHYPLSKGLHEWIARHNVYSTTEQELIVRQRAEPLALGELFGSDPIRRRRCAKRILAREPWLRLFIFGYLYFIRGGFLDGGPGFLFCLLRLGQESHIVAKVAEARWTAMMRKDIDPTLKPDT